MPSLRAISAPAESFDKRPACGVARAGGVPNFESRTLQDTLRRAIATRLGYCPWDVDHAGWVVALHSPEEHEFYGRILEQALAWTLVWLMEPDLGFGLYLA